MTHFLRFLIQVDPGTDNDPVEGTLNGWWVSITCPQKADLIVGNKRFLKRLASSGPDDFPCPARNEPLPELLQDAAGQLSVTKLEEIFEAVNARSAENQHMRLYGRYLFDTLIGPNWPEMTRVASEEASLTPDDLLVELALRWSIDQSDLHRLHWEAMHDGGHFLAALSRDPFSAAQPAAGKLPPILPLTITRVVPTGDSVPAPLPFSPPVRILFALGVPVNNDQVRPGAEFVGFLRRLRLEDQEYQLNARLLENVSPSMLRDTAAEFRPHVIHFISHGNVEPAKGPFLVLAREDGQPEQEQNRLFGSDLIKQLGSNLPVITVLSACYTAGQGEKPGRIMSGATTAPMAAQLVAGGIPIVVGMSGQVADLACRLFTRGFGSALVRGDPLLLATAQGRWAACTPGIPSENWIDWAFPTVFLADTVAVDFVTLDTQHENTASKIDKWVADLKVGGQPVFCGRQDIFQDFYSLFTSQKKAPIPGGRPGKPILVIKVPDPKKGLGRYRMLTELAIEAVRSAHLPLLIADEREDWQPPTNPLELAKRLHEAIVTLRNDVYSIGYEYWKRPRLMQVALLDKLSPNPKDLEKPENLEKLDPEVIQRSAGDGTEIPAAAIRAALQIEIFELLQDMREKHPDVITADSRVVVLLNRVQDYQKALEALALGKTRWLGDYGLGDAFGSGLVKEPVPVVMIYSYSSNKSAVNASDQLRAAFEESIGNIGGVRTRILGAFDRKSGEDMLAYYRVLLHPFKHKLNSGDDLKPLTINPLVKPEARTPFNLTFQYALKGIPEMFWSEEFDQLVVDLWKGGTNYLVEARDEDILNDLIKEQGKQMALLRQTKSQGPPPPAVTPTTGGGN